MEVSKETWRAVAISGICCLLAISVLLKFGGAYDYGRVEERVKFLEEQKSLLQGQIDVAAVLIHSQDTQIEILRNQVNNGWVYGKRRIKVGRN